MPGGSFSSEGRPGLRIHSPVHALRLLPRGLPHLRADEPGKIEPPRPGGPCPRRRGGEAGIHPRRPGRGLSLPRLQGLLHRLSVGGPRRNDHGVLPEPGAGFPPPFPPRRDAAGFHPETDAPLARADGNLHAARPPLPAPRPPVGGPPSRDQPVPARRPRQDGRDPPDTRPAAAPGDSRDDPRPGQKTGPRRLLSSAAR